jgi:hypothetical protein
VKLKGKGGGWESAIDQEESEFRSLLWNMDELRKIRFPRCVIPIEGLNSLKIKKKRLLLVYLL